MRALLVVALLVGVASGDPAKDRADAAAKVYPALVANLNAGKATVEQVGAWSIRWVDASQDKPSKALADHLARMKDLETLVATGFKAGLRDAVDVTMSAYFRSEAELWVARGKR